MCQALEAANVSASRLSVVQPSAPDPLGVEVIVATPALRSQFGPRLATVYAPLVLASFGSGAQRIDIRYLAPGGTAAFEASLASAEHTRVEAGQQLLSNKNVQASAQARDGPPGRRRRSPPAYNAWATCPRNAGTTGSF